MTVIQEKGARDEQTFDRDGDAAVRVSLNMEQGDEINESTISNTKKPKKRYEPKNREVNVKKESQVFRYDPYLPFQNVKLKNDYYLVPT